MKETTLAKLQQVVTNLQAVARDVMADGREALASNDHVAIITHYDQLRQVNATIKEARTALSEIEDAFSKQHVPDVLDEQGVKSITLIGVGRVTVSHRFSCSMLDKEAGMQWLRDEGHGSLIQPTVNSSTLAAFAKDIVVNQGGSLPEDLFKVGTAPYTSITKA